MKKLRDPSPTHSSLGFHLLRSSEEICARRRSSGSWNRDRESARRWARSPGCSDEGMVRSSALMKIVSPCWKPSPNADSAGGGGGGGGGRADGLLWYKDLGRHGGGEFSMAVVQANNLLEDGSQIESGPLSFGGANSPHGTFVGIYDGHGGPETSRFIADNLFRHLKSSISKGKFEDALKKMCKEGAYWGKTAIEIEGLYCIHAAANPLSLFAMFYRLSPMHIFYFSRGWVFRSGTVAGVYVGMEYGMERIRGTRDWGLPKHFCDSYLPKHDATITLVDEEGDEFETNYLAYKAGLSGGWQGFSVFHELIDGDVLIFQLIEPTKFKVYIVRAGGCDQLMPEEISQV